MLHINFSPSASWVASSFNESVLPAFNGKLKIIVIVAAIALGLLAACYVAWNFFNTEVTTVTKKSTIPPAGTIATETIAAPVDVEPKPVSEPEKEIDPFEHFKHPEHLPPSEDLLADVKPVAPKKNMHLLDSAAQKKLAALKDEIRHELKEPAINADKLKSLIEEYSKLSIFVPLEYLPTHEEILRTFAKRLHDTIPSKAAWDKLLPLIELIWKMAEYNPLEKPEYKEVYDRVVKLQSDLLTLDIKMKQTFEDRKTVESLFAISLQQAQSMLAFVLSDEGKQLIKQEQLKEQAKRDKAIKELDEQVKTIQKKLKELSEPTHFTG